MTIAIRLASVALLLATVAAVPSLDAQPSLAHVQLPTGARVRVTAPSVLPDPVIGRVISRTPEGLAISRNEGRVQITFTPEQVEMIEVSEGRHRLKWATLGGLGGMLVGSTAGAWQGARSDPTGAGFGAALGLLGGGIVGLFSGAIAGGLLAPEVWERHLFSATR